MPQPVPAQYFYPESRSASARQCAPSRLPPVRTCDPAFWRGAHISVSPQSLGAQEFRWLLDAAPDAMVIVEQHGNVVAVSRESEALFGWSEADLLGHPMERLIATRFQHIHKSQRESLDTLASGAVRRAPLAGLARRRDGTEFPVEISQSRLGVGKDAYLLVTIRDLTEWRRAQDTLYQQKERALVTLESIGDAIITTDPVGAITYMNPVAERLTGWRSGEGVGQQLDTVLTLISESTRMPVESLVARCLREGRVVDLPEGILLLRRDATEVAVDDSVAPILDRNGVTVGVVVVFHDISERRRVDVKLTHAAAHDALTGLVNRVEFERRLARCVTDAAGDSRGEHALGFLDLDGFKLINDSCGHEAGDQVLRNLGTLMSADMRRRDTIARVGGDEFCILLEHCGMPEAEEIAANLCRKVADYRFTWHGKEFAVTVSIGMVPIVEHSGSMATVMRSADAACYAAKDSGGGRVNAVSTNRGPTALRELEARRVSRLTRAIEEGRFELHVQPIVPLLPELPIRPHFEMLLRLPDDRGGLQNEESFFPQAERYRLMPAIDRWVVTRTLALLGVWRRANPHCALPLCSINLSATTLQGDFLDFVAEQLSTNELPGDALCFEISEADALGNFAQTVHMVSHLRTAGCMVALENFGHSMTSFAYLKALPVDFVKLGGHYVRGIAADPIYTALVGAINQIGRTMGIATVAEDVDSDDDLEKLRELGVYYAQGSAAAPSQSFSDATGTLVLPCYEKSA
ncbi:MAG: EAL domain-containing protein [Gemmatimonadota bacterium]